jgi:hypothetical protein
MAKDYVAVYRSLLKRPTMSEHETVVPGRQSFLEREVN